MILLFDVGLDQFFVFMEQNCFTGFMKFCTGTHANYSGTGKILEVRVVFFYLDFQNEHNCRTICENVTAILPEVACSEVAFHGKVSYKNVLLLIVFVHV